MRFKTSLLCIFTIVCNIKAEKAPEEIVVDLLEKIYDSPRNFPNVEDYTISGSSPQVKTSSGTIFGVNTNYSSSFYGIPFAVPPVGELRFRAPQMLNTPDVIRNLSSVSRTRCQQLRGENDTSEDCLVLNVHVPENVDLSDPENPPADRLPVMYWIHGGAYHFGAGTFQAYEGKYLAQVINSIIVTVNYRLGPFGFLLFDEGGITLEGNQGLKDQQLGMEWVQNNIEHFGGDKNRVTIFGESAGAQSVMFHLISGNSNPLFHRAIMESNPAVYKYPTRHEALETTSELIGHLRCNGSIIAIPNPNCCRVRKDNYRCLMDAEPEELMRAMAKMMGSGWVNLDPMFAIEPFLPYIDGVEFTKQPLKLFSEGSWQKDKPIILGTNAEEAVVIKYVLPIPNENLFRGINEALFKGVGKYENTGDLVSQKYIDMFGPNITDYGHLFGIEMTDIWFGCPSRTLARYAAATTETSVYLYVFSHGLDGDDCIDILGNLCGHSYHGHELYFVFRTIEHRGFIPDNLDVAVSDQFSTYWGSFARTGNPSNGLDTPLPGNFGDWYPYSETTMLNGYSWVSMRFDEPENYQETGYLKEICDFWDSLGLYGDFVDEPDMFTSTPVTSVDVTQSTTKNVGADETTSGAAQSKPIYIFFVFSAIVSFYPNF